MALALGALAAFAFAPWHWSILLPIGLSGLLFLLDRATSWRRALLLGWLFGFGHFTVGLYWITESFAVDPQRFGALAIPALLALSAYLASFPALACVTTRLVGTAGPWRLLVFAAAWSATEWLRGTLFTGFPWNLVAYVWTPYLAPLQAASVLGAYGLGFATVVLAGLPRLAFDFNRRPILTLWPLALLLAGVAMLWAFGMMRLADAIDGDVANVRLRLVQAGIAQRDKWDPALRDRIIHRYRALTAAPAAVTPTHIVWPESALPFVVSGAPEELKGIVAGLIPAGGVLIAGADRRTPRFEGQSALRNSVLAVDAQGSIVAAYDKVHLVPFGEYVPLREILPLQKMIAGTVDFEAGAARNVLAIQGLPPVIPLICYEAIFPPGRTSVPGGLWLLNVTNDAWFGASAGPYQHFEIARMRAVESGVPLVRAANTGISAVVDAYGRVRASLALNQVGILDTGLPLAIPERTLYARVGDTLLAVGVLCIFVVAVRASLQERRTRPALGAVP